MFSISITLLALAASATAHMTMEYPVPYGLASLNSSPLAPGDFPCKQRTGVYDVTSMNQWNAGETKTVSFKGSAVHGGGSCQFSVTTDQKPTEQSQWKVIQSVIGGCPSNATGNLTPDPEGHGAATFPVTMPADMPAGQYTFAWTWLNKIGNREFYMNCAPIQVGSTSGQVATASVSAALSKLPDMFVANLPSDSCTTTEGQDFSYPNPGQNVIKGASATPGNGLSGSGCTAQNKLGSGNGQIGTPSQPSGSPAQSSAAVGTPSQPKASNAPVASAPVSIPNKQPAKPSNSGGVFAPGASSAPVAQPTAQPSAPAAPTSTAIAQPVASAIPNNTTPSNGECVPCTNDGAVVCMGEGKFGLCNRGCAVPQDVALGMECSNGAVVGATKRTIHFPRAHLHRRHSARLL